MKIVKRLLPILLIILAVFSIGCSHSDKTEVKEVITRELDLLKNLDSHTTMKYVSYKELFPDATKDTELSNEIKEVFALFFQNFNYKILDVNVNKKKKTASASVRLVTLDAHALAEDFAASCLKSEIMEASHNSENTNDSMNSMEKHYLVLNHLLKTKDYKTVEDNCTISLHLKEGLWEINHSDSLENNLVGGLITYLSDPDILSPENTLKIYLKTLKKMNLEEMSNYLGIESILTTTDTAKNSIASALVEQVHKNFNYKIIKSNVNGYNASVETAISTFDSDSILHSYQEKLDAYLASPDAVIDGSEKRYEKSHTFLLETIEANKDTTTAAATFHLINDGASWKLKAASSELGNAIFGTLITTPVSEETAEEAEEEEATEEENYEDSDYEESEDSAYEEEE